MLKKLSIFLLAGLSFIVGGFTTAWGADYAPLSSEAAAAFQKELDQVIGKAEKRVKELEKNATRKDVAPTWNSKVELQNAIVQLEVKKTLVSNFKGTESLRSARVRKKLMEVLSKPDISTSDLAELQNLVIDEKAKIHEASMPKANVP